MSWEVKTGDCLDILRSIADSSVDSVVTDPPAGIGLEYALKSEGSDE